MLINYICNITKFLRIMKRNILKHFFLPVSILLIFVVFVSLSKCKKDTNCSANILILNKYDSSRVPFAKVIIKCGNTADLKCRIRDTGLSSLDGKFVYNRKLEAILDVKVLLDTNAKNNETPLYNTTKNIQFYGTDLLRLQAGKTVELTIWLDTIIPRGQNL